MTNKADKTKIIRPLPLLLFLLLASPAWALTTVTGTLLQANGTAYRGSFRITWQTFMNASSQTIQGGFINVTLASNGTFSVALEPTTSSVPTTTYRVDFDQIRNATRATEYWSVGASSPTTHAAVRTLTPGTPSSIITALPNLVTVGTITTGVWNGTVITVPYGGTGVATLTGPIKGNGTSAFSTALAADIVALWASGTCSGYLKDDGTCSALGGASIASTTNLIEGDGAGNGVSSGIAAATVVKGAAGLTTQYAMPYVSSAGTLAETNLSCNPGTSCELLNDPFFYTKASANEFGQALTVRKRGATGDATAAVVTNAELGYWSFDGWDGTQYKRGGLVIMYATENWSGVQAGSKMGFYTNPAGSTTNTLALQIGSNGNVLVGSVGSASTYRLDVQESGSAGTARFYDQSMSGVTKVVARPGASQGTVSKFQIQDSGGSTDVGWDRNAAGVLEINSGTAGTYRDLKLRTLKQSPLTVATLPPTPAAGDVVYISDSATGDCATGGGSIFAGCRYSGSAWEAF